MLILGEYLTIWKLIVAFVLVAVHAIFRHFVAMMLRAYRLQKILNQIEKELQKLCSVDTKAYFCENDSLGLWLVPCRGNERSRLWKQSFPSRKRSMEVDCGIYAWLDRKDLTEDIRTPGFEAEGW